jgi:hypothetical protein
MTEIGGKFMKLNKNFFYERIICDCGTMLIFVCNIEVFYKNKLHRYIFSHVSERKKAVCRPAA